MEERAKLAEDKRQLQAARKKERYESDPAYREHVRALSKLHRDERKAAKVAVSGTREKADAPSTR